MYLPLKYTTKKDVDDYLASTLAGLSETDEWLNVYARKELSCASSCIEGILLALLLRVMNGEALSGALLPPSLRLDAEVQATTLAHHIVQCMRVTGAPVSEGYALSIFSLHILHDVLDDTTAVAEEVVGPIVLGNMLSGLVSLSDKLSVTPTYSDVELALRVQSIIEEYGMKRWWLPNTGAFWGLWG